MRPLTALALLLAVGASIAAPQSVAAQDGGSPPSQLWKEYPLDETAPSSPPDAETRVGDVPQAQPLSGEEGGGGSPAIVIALALLAAGAALAVLWGAQRRRAGAVPAPTSANVRSPARPALDPPAPKTDPVEAQRPPVEARRPPAKLLPPATESPADAEQPPLTSGPATAAPATAAASLAAKGAARRPALGYTTVAASGEAERDRLREEAKVLRAACDEHGLVLGKLVRDLDSQSGSDLHRPGLTYALERLGAGEYECLVVSRLDRLTRSAATLGALVGILKETDARLLVLDIGLDTGTPDGRVAADALMTVGGIDAKKIEERTRKGLEAARSGASASGRPAVADRPSLKQRIVDMRANGMTLQAIADTLNAEGVPTMRGGAQWRPSSVQAAAGYKRPKRGRGRGKPA